ncbi:MAG: TPM domain-containing protein [Candidatus Omnitrophota bacterium]
MRFPSPAGYVNDYAGVLSREARSQLENLSTQIEQKTTAEIAIVTVRTTAPLTIEQYAVELFQKWGIGKKGNDNGILLLVAVDDRKVRIEVGYGLEGAVTDLQSKIIIQDLIVPAFKRGDFGLGISSGALALAKLVSAEYGVQIDLGKQMATVPTGRRARRSPLGSLITLLFFMLIFGFRFGALFFLMGSGGGYWSGGSGGSFGGGFGGFGGGMSGGGGASGSW